MFTGAGQYAALGRIFTADMWQQIFITSWLTITIRRVKSRKN